MTPEEARKAFYKAVIEGIELWKNQPVGSVEEQAETQVLLLLESHIVVLRNTIAAMEESGVK